MSSATIASIQQLAGQFREHERNLTLYFADLDTPPPADCANRVFGPPVGLTDAQWPTFPELAELLMQSNTMQHWDPSDQRMEHVFTIDLRGVSLLGLPPDAAAMMLFISNASFHRASHDGNPHTAVRFVREADLRRGVYQGPLPRRSMARWSRRFSLVPVDVPGDVFDVPELNLAVGHPLVALHEAIAAAPARLGGCPIVPVDEDEASWADSSPTLPWAGSGSSAEARTEARTEAGSSGHASAPGRGFEHYAATLPRTSGSFVMQFHQRFADVALGQRGVMYVSGSGAYQAG